jgi:hypothetical protein
VDLAHRHRVAGHAVEQAEHPEALIAQRFGNGQRQLGGAPAQHRRNVGCRDHDRTSRPPGSAKRLAEEAADLEAAFADHTDHQRVGAGIAGDHPEQGRLADPGTGEDPEALSLAARGEEVEGTDPEVEPVAEGTAAMSGNRTRLKAVGP